MRPRRYSTPSGRKRPNRAVRRALIDSAEGNTSPPSPLVGWPHVPRLKISHRLFAARCVTAIIDRGRLLPRRYRPKPRLCLRCLRMVHDAPDYWPARVTEPDIIVVLVPMVRATAFA